MNRTEKAKRDMVIKMLRGQIDVEEVAAISGVDLQEVQQIREDLDKQEREALGGMTIREMGVGSVVIDDEKVDEHEDEVEAMRIREMNEE